MHHTALLFLEFGAIILALGLLAALALRVGISPIPLGWGPVAAVAMAGLTYATSSGITAKVLSDLGWIGNRETPVALSLLVFEDLTMAVYLPLTVLLAGLSLVAGMVAVAVALASVSVVLLVALRYGHVIEAFVRSPNPEVLLLKVVGLALLVAGVAQHVQVSAAVRSVRWPGWRCCLRWSARSPSW
ncbi:cation:proton antiporter [Nonomuraea sp. NBC_00507]|uniref:cation:proton antiporter domain-containing protein n=1 Tax=Nonomuraea sp. NBC_00507 TaxID=2976002 RepID=UPI002E17C316